MTANCNCSYRSGMILARFLAVFIWIFLPILFVLPWIALAQSAGSAQTATARTELVLQTGHTSSVDAVAFSQDGRWLAKGQEEIMYTVTGNSPEIPGRPGHFLRPEVMPS